MRIVPIFAAMAFAIGLSVTPAAADIRLATPANSIGAPVAQPETTNPTADQYRDRRWREDRGWRGDRWRGNRGWRGGYRYRSYGYRNGYRYRSYGYRNGYRWRGATWCRTSWRYGRPYRVCWRR